MLMLLVAEPRSERPLVGLAEATCTACKHSTAQHSTAQHSTAQHSTAQHSTAQHSTAQHSTAQHSTKQGERVVSMNPNGASMFNATW
jgi:hypothetical protein